LVTDALFIGQAQADKLRCKPAPCDLEEYCRELIEEISTAPQNFTTSTAGTSIPKIAFSVRGNCTHAKLDEKLLRQILTNLLSNAIKYSPEGGTIRFGLECVENAAHFCIQDSGIGIPPESLPQLFDSFYRARNVGTIPGTGLGLAIVKKCVDLHGGEITVNSEIDKGTKFTVTLPLK
jgi:signal transduction histidine kinase